MAWLAGDVGTGASATTRTDLARARVAVALAAGDVACAEEAAVRALEIADEPAAAFSRGRLELVAGAMWRRAGSIDRAVASLEAARGRFDRLGAAPWRGRAEGELARAGRRPARRPPVATPLTPQEWAVAHVVAAGRSNRERRPSCSSA